ncbi:hypothetical protein COLO4_30268 [Corchorus olitorius]|uniref:Uncharacterized protein n=1 Tax=Corchorus olitorius TaxID=93759 RepID=A0A1R3H9E8_9ROSI|nr:hypothetical protein COLO4_30268 [Corchorus olitorius]
MPPKPQASSDELLSHLTVVVIAQLQALQASIDAKYSTFDAQYAALSTAISNRHFSLRDLHAQITSTLPPLLPTPSHNPFSLLLPHPSNGQIPTALGLSKIKVNLGILRDKNYLVFIEFRPSICFDQSPAFVSAHNLFAKIHKLVQWYVLNTKDHRVAYWVTKIQLCFKFFTQHIVALFWLIMVVVNSSISDGFGKVFSSANPKKIIFYGLAPVLVVSCLDSPPYQRASQVLMHSSSFKIVNLFIITNLCVLASKSKSLYGKAIKDYGIVIAMSFDRVKNGTTKFQKLNGDDMVHVQLRVDIFRCLNQFPIHGAPHALDRIWTSLGTYCNVALYVFNLEGKVGVKEKGNGMNMVSSP